MDDEDAAASLELPRGAKPSRKGRSRVGTEVQPETPKNTQKKPASLVPALPDGRRCDTCANKDSDEDPVILKLMALHKENFAVILETKVSFFTMLRRQADGKILCWWGYPQQASGETKSNQCGYCMSAYMARVKPRKITLKAWKASLGLCPKMLESHQKLVTVMVDSIVEKGVSCFLFVRSFVC